MWCSHRLKNSMSRTTTISSYFTSYNAPFRICSTFISYPLVRKRRALSTRSGVRARPSRFGSSPKRPNISSTSGAIDSSPVCGSIILTTALFDFIGSHFKDVPRRLADANLLQLRPLPRKHLLPIPFQPAADLKPQILRRRHHTGKRRHFLVQVAVVERPHHFPLHQFIEHGDVHRPARRPIERPAHAHFHHVVVSVAVGIVAFAVQGTDITLNDLDNQYNAVFLAIGTWKEAWVYLPGTELKGVIPALLFLEAVAKEEPVRLGRKVAVIGGGNAAIDSARTALRMGAEVTVIYRRERQDMPAIREETDAAEEEGAKFHFLATPHRIVGDEDGNVKAIEVVKTRLGEFDASGRRRPVPTEEIQRLECDTVILAVGEAVDEDFLRASGLRIKENGTLEVDRYTMETSRSKFYAGGDLISGASNVSNAMGYGKKAARKMDQRLMGAYRWDKIDPGFVYSNAPPGEPSSSERHTLVELPARERVESFVESMISLSDEETLDEASRCLRCDIKDHH